VFQLHSQTTSKTELRVQTIVNTNGDTLIQMSLADAKILLNDVLDKQVADSLINFYISREKEFSTTINLQKKEILDLSSKNVNLTKIMLDDSTILINKDSEITSLNETINKQKKEIRKQKFLKIIGFSAAIILPILVVISIP
jgi:hypothetical protein